MNSKQRNYLTKKAHDLKAEVYIGKNGINENIIDAAKENIDKNELLKVKVHNDSPVKKKNAADYLSEEIDAEIVRILGNIIILFKQKTKKSNYNIPK